MKMIAIVNTILFLTVAVFAQNFGIGTTNPGAKLEISGVGGTHDGVLTEHIRLGADASHYSSIKTAFSNTVADNKLTFSVDQDHSSSPIDVMTLRGDGTVGIGTISPTEKLDVAGNITASGYIKSTAVGFFARTNSHRSAAEYLVYNTTSHNTGGAYNNGNGRFTAPTRGLYHFCWGGIQNPASTVSRTYLHVNGSNYAGSGTQLRLDSGSAYGDGCNCATLPLDQNDWVGIYLGAGGAYQDYTWFTGHLVSAY